MFDNESQNIFLALTGASVLKHVVSSWISKFSYPKEFRLVGEVAQLFIYPMKSGKAIELETAECTTFGICHQGIYDRHWVLATKNGTFVDQIMVPRLALVETSIHGDVIHFDAPGMTTLQLSTNPTVDESCIKKIDTSIGKGIDALDCGDEAAAWFQEFTKRKNVRFYFSSSNMEKRKGSEQSRAWEHEGRPCDKMAFSNFSAYQMINTTSVDYLNSQLESPISFRNFRPSILIKGTNAFEEDKFNEVKLGEATFKLLDKNPRCTLVCVDQSTGKSDKNIEPFKTLKKFRTFPKYGPEKPCIGIYLGLNQPARISVGDPVYYK